MKNKIEHICGCVDDKDYVQVSKLLESLNVLENSILSRLTNHLWANFDFKFLAELSQLYVKQKASNAFISGNYVRQNVGYIGTTTVGQQRR